MPLSTGDIAPDLILTDRDGKEWNIRSDAIAGNPIAIIFCPRLNSAGRRILENYVQQGGPLKAEGGRIFAVTLDKTDQLPDTFGFPVLWDRREQVFGDFRVPRDHPSTVILRRNHHVGGFFEGWPEEQVGGAIALVQSLGWERKTVLMGVHPPVLLIPDAFSKDDCSRLIDIFQKKGQAFVDPQPAINLMNGSDYKMRIPEHMREDQIDHFSLKKVPWNFSAID
jgi:peroxiredoxin